MHSGQTVGMGKSIYVNINLYMNNYNICSESLNINKRLLLLYIHIIMLKLVIINNFYTFFRSGC